MNKEKNIYYKVRLKPINLKRDMSKMLDWHSNKKVLYYSELQTNTLLFIKLTTLLKAKNCRYLHS